MYALTIGIHKGTITSRDVEPQKTFETMDECWSEVRNANDTYRRIGYTIWFAEVVKPDGEKVTLVSNTNYSR